MSFTRCIKLNAARAGKVSVSGTEILAGVVLNQCFSNVLRVHKTSPRANPGTWSQKWPKCNLFEIPDCENRIQDLAVSVQQDYPIEPKYSANLKICLMSRYIFPRSFQLLKNVLPGQCRPDSSVAMTCEHKNHQSTHNPCESPGMPCESFRIGINLKFVKLQCTICSTTCKCRTTRSQSMNCSSLVQIQLLLIKPILFSMEK